MRYPRLIAPARFSSLSTRFLKLELASSGVVWAIALLLSMVWLAASPAAAQTAFVSGGWSQQSPGTLPSARYNGAAAFDAKAGNVVFFGGRNTSSFFADTWIWNASGWSLLSPATSPSARAYPAMAYDAQHQQIVLFGGFNGSTFLQDTWTWDGTTWTPQSPTTKPPATIAHMAYDAATNSIVLLDGVDISGNHPDGTWVWNGSNWIAKSPATSPTARSYGNMAYDPSTGKVLLFGGDTGVGQLQDTWTWDGTTWALLSPTTKPTARRVAVMGQDPGSGHLVLFGGQNNSGYLTDTWLWNGSTWTQESNSGTSNSEASMMAPDPLTGSMVFFGGQNFSGNPSRENWIYQAFNTDFGTNFVGNNTTQTIEFQFATGGTIQAPGVLTQGATGKDFTDAGTGNCTTNGTSHSYVAGEVCTVDVKFSPAVPGVRTGAVVLYNSSGTAIATANIQGIGAGPMLSVPSNAPQVQLASGASYTNPAGIAVDGAGNVFVSDYTTNKIYKITASSGYATSTQIASSFGFSVPVALAVDGAGNVFVADYGNNAVQEILANGGYTTVRTIATGFDNNAGIAVDRFGNVFVADTFNSIVKEVLAGTGYSYVTTIATGVNHPYGLGVDASDNLFVGDTVNHEVLEFTASSGYATSSVIATGIGFPYGFAVDAAGDVYFGNASDGFVRELTSASNYATVLTFGSTTSPAGLAIDSSGNLFVSDQTTGKIWEIKAAYSVLAAPTVSFATTAEGQTSSDSPKTVTFENIGNTDLNISNVIYATDFPEASGASTDCFAGLNLTAGNTCTMTINFSPVLNAIAGNTALSESVSMTDNNLNFSNVTQSVAVSGTETRPTPTISIANIPTAAVYGDSLTPSFNYVGDGSISVVSNTTGTCTVTGSTVHFVGLGTCSLTVSATAGSIYNAASGSAQTFSISQATPTISISNLPSGGTYFSSFTPTYSYVGDGTPSVQSNTTSVCLVALGVVHYVGLGQCSVTASATAGTNYTSTTGSAQTFMVVAGTPTAIAINGGNSQSTYAGTQFGTQLAANVTDTLGNPVPGAIVTFLAPASGASGTFSNGTNTIDAQTDSFGTARATFTANSTSGTYSVAAGTSGVANAVLFGLTNTPPPSFVVNTTTDDGAGNASNCPMNPSGTGAGSCTLRDAITAADAAGVGTITFDPTVFTSGATITPTSLLYSDAADSFNARASFSITAPVSGVTLDGGLLFSGSNLLLFGAGRTVSLSGFTIQNVTGAAMHVLEDANVTITNSSFNSNGVGIQADDPGNDGLTPTVNVLNSTFANNSNNSTTVGGGGIYAAPGKVTVSNSLFANDSATEGGAIYTTNGSLTIQNTTFSSNFGQSGGAMFVDGTNVTVVNSTIASNQATYGGAGIFVNTGTVNILYSTFTGNVSQFGAAISTGDTVAISNSTITGNVSTSFAGAIDNEGNSITIGNTILAGNFSSVFNDAVGGYNSQGNNLVGDLNGTSGFNGSDLTGITNPQLGTLGNYGGPTQTLIPLPGSPVLCAGSQALIPNGLGADQRGVANTNSTYPGYSSSPCVDIGSVQTHYQLAFTGSAIPSTLTANVAITPAPQVSVTDNLVGIAGATVSLSDVKGALNGTTSQSTSSLGATFGGLSIGKATTGDSLIASLQLTPTLALTANSTSFNVVFNSNSLAQITSPSNGATNVDASSLVTISWTSVANPQTYYLYIGTTLGGTNVYISGNTLNTSVQVALSANTKYYLRIFTKQNNGWSYSDSSFTTGNLGKSAVITSPTNGATNVDASSPVTISWVGGLNVATYYLYVGTTQGSANVYGSGEVTVTSEQVKLQPSTTYYCRIFTKNTSNGWSFTDSSFTTGTQGTPAAIITPANGATGVDGSQPVSVTWNSVSGALTYFLYVGTTPGGTDIYTSGETSNTSATITQILKPSTTYYLRLFTKFSGGWKFHDTTFTTGSLAAMAYVTSPANGATGVTHPGVTISWSSATSPQAYFLYVGSTLGANDVFAYGETLNTSVGVTGLSANTTYYLRMWTRNSSGVWHYNDSTFTTGP